MKSWKQIRKDRRLTVDHITYHKDDPYRFMFNGAIKLNGQTWFSVIAGSDEDGWEHVSVYHPKRCPTWEEMCAIKDVFWNEDEECIQIHPKRSEYVNIVDTCLHIWRHKGGMILPEGT